MLYISNQVFKQSGRGKVSYIDIYDPSTKTLKSIYKHDVPITCVGATISETHTLLGIYFYLFPNNKNDFY